MDYLVSIELLKFLMLRLNHVKVFLSFFHVLTKSFVLNFAVWLSFGTALLKWPTFYWIILNRLAQVIGFYTWKVQRLCWYGFLRMIVFASLLIQQGNSVTVTSYSFCYLSWIYTSSFLCEKSQFQEIATWPSHRTDDQQEGKGIGRNNWNA